MNEVNPLLREMRGSGSGHLERIAETELQSSIFRSSQDTDAACDLDRLRERITHDRQIPIEVAQQVLARISDQMEHLGLQKVPAALVELWLNALLKERGYSSPDTSRQNLEIGLGEVERNLHQPFGMQAGSDQNPEATGKRIAQRIKAQYAARRVFQEEVLRAHDLGEIDLPSLGTIDRPQDVFLTPEYLKKHGLPLSKLAPSAGPAHRIEVLLAQMIRFTNELQNHFAGDIQWGFCNTLLLPYLVELNDQELEQVLQELLFEFAQLDVERGGMCRQVILDMDFDVPKILEGLQAIGTGGVPLGRTYAELKPELERFNRIFLGLLAKGDARGNPFHSPTLVYHINDSKGHWSPGMTELFALAYRIGNPAIAFSGRRRDCGALGMKSLNDPDFLRMMLDPASLRGCSLGSIGLNLPRMAYGRTREAFLVELERVLDLVVTAHRQKRLFISRLMAYGQRGPLQFLRHRLDDKPFLRIDDATQPMQLIGLSEAAALFNGSAVSSPEALTREAKSLLEILRHAIRERNRRHKLRMQISRPKDDNMGYRFAALDLRQFGKAYSAFLFHQPEQAHPVYTEGSNIHAFRKMKWRDRLRQEAQLHPYFDGSHALTLFLESGKIDDVGQFAMIFREAVQQGVSRIQFAPDLKMCYSCFFLFGAEFGEFCPACKSSMLTDFGYCQSFFSPVNSWSLGKRAEWKIRHRMDHLVKMIQSQLPW